MSATTGAAPVPVPPPMPAVTNTMSAPSSAFAMSSRDSVAAWRPISGFAPAPRPRVSAAPVLVLPAVHAEPAAGRVDGALHPVDQPADAARSAAPHRHAHHFLGELVHAGQQGRAAGDDHAAGEQLGEAVALDLAVDELE